LGGVTSGGVFGLPVLYPALGANPMSQFFRSSFCWKLDIIRVFRGP